MSFINKHKFPILHISFWLVYLSYRTIGVLQWISFKEALTYGSLYTGLDLIPSYIHYFFFLPQWLKNKKAFQYFLKVILLIAVTVIVRLRLEGLVVPIMFPDEADYYYSITPTRITGAAWDALSFIIFTGMMRFTFDWFELENKKKQLENEKLIAELNYLKAQINPHFLFNTLHNLNYLVYAGSARATEVIIKLSNIMRYMIYDANKDKVSLEKEIAYMNDYIHLEGIRLNKKFTIDFNVSGNDKEVEIAPLIMITFLENAFKHGVSDQEENCWIKVKLDITEKDIQYYVSNKKLKLPVRNKLRSGFGLSNVRKRLQLSYPEKHELNIVSEGDSFEVSLKLDRS
jgi:hypothetical protein